MLRTVLRLTATALVLVPTVALAHPAIGDASGLAHGFAHPLSGLDHILAMVTVGLLAAHLGGRALWLVPLSFVTVMAAAGAIGMAGIQLPFADIGIAGSVVVLGLLVASRLHLPTALAMGVVGVFAIFHGHVHGTEMPADAAGLAYGAGFLAATALLHAAGIAIGLWIGRAGEGMGRRVAQLGGAAVALAGIWLLSGAL